MIYKTCWINCADTSFEGIQPRLSDALAALPEGSEVVSITPINDNGTTIGVIVSYGVRA